LEVRCVRSTDHLLYSLVILAHWFVILERHCHAHVPGISGTLDQTLAAPAPDFFFRESFVDDRPIPFSDVVGGQLRMARDPPPGEEHAEMFRAQVGGHSDQIAHETDLGLTHFGDRVAEVVIGGDAVNLDSFAARQTLQFLATSPGPVQRIAVRTLAIDLYAVVSEFFCGAYEFGQSEGFASIPATEVSDAIESNFHFGFDRGCFSAAHTIALRKMVVKASFSKSQGPCPMKIYSTSHRNCILTSEAIPGGSQRRWLRFGSRRSVFGTRIGRD